MRTLYSYTGENNAEFRRDFRGVIRREFFEGDMQLDASTHFDVTFGKSLNHPISVIRLVTDSEISFRRSVYHIRDDNIGVRVIWFFRAGRFELTRPTRSYTVSAGEWCILGANEPLFVRAIPEAGGRFDACGVIVPPQIFHSHLAGTTEFAEPFSMNLVGQRLITKFLNLILEEKTALCRANTPEIT